MLRAAILFMSFSLLAVTGVAAYSALAACRVEWGPIRALWPEMCRSEADIAVAERLDVLRARYLELQHEILLAENALGKIQCEAVHAPPPPAEQQPEPAPVPPPADVTAPGPEVPQIDEQRWRSGDIGLLDGCWELDSDYRTQNVRTGRITHFNEWTMCFSGGAGAGRETMTATDGTTCSGPVSGRFDQDNRLVVREPRNLECSDNSFIYRRIVTCELAENGVANCVTAQPERNTRSEVRLRRRAGD